MPLTTVPTSAEPSEQHDSKDPNEPKAASSSGSMPKIQKCVKVHDNQVVFLAKRAVNDIQLEGALWKKSKSSDKWQMRYYVLYQNLLFYFENKDKEKPLGVIFLEGSYVERCILSDNELKLATPEKSKEKKKDVMDVNLCFQISFRKDYVRKFDFCGMRESDTLLWVYELERASFGKQHLEMQKVTAKHLHIIQVVETEQTAKWQFSLHCEDLYAEMRFLREELTAVRRQRNVEKIMTDLVHTCKDANDPGCLCCRYDLLQGDQEKLDKLRKVQSFFRGWLCRRKWKQIVDQYIKSPHAQLLRKRNNVVFQLVESEEEYIGQMEILITCFLRPFKMAASSRKPPCTHDDVNSIFLNSETVFFLHQIFFKGLTARLENWPTLILGDLFSMLLPMLNIYQEYVRNHHYSLQVLTECKQNPPFAATLKRLESKPICNGRSLETFLTYPMHQIPRYIVTLHELLSHTPYNHVERKSLESAQVQLEHLSKLMHDEVSETENLRKNLAVERMIAEGCDILLDVNQIFVRQGTLIQVPTDKQKEKKSFKSFKSSPKTEKEVIRQCYLFSYHMIITTRGSDGFLHLVPNIGKVSMSDAILIEEPTEKVAVETPFGSDSSATTTDMARTSYQGRDFKLVIDCKSRETPIICHFIAPTVSEKAAWISDIAGCIDNAQFGEILKPQMAETSSISLPQYIRNDPRLFHDEPDIRFSKVLNSCKIPQIRYATPDRLLERLTVPYLHFLQSMLSEHFCVSSMCLAFACHHHHPFWLHTTDLRFLSIDFLNTFLLTYKVFTDDVKVLTALKRVYYASVEKEKERMAALGLLHFKDENTLLVYDDYRKKCGFFTPRRTSGASSISGYFSEASDRDRSLSYDSQGQRIFRSIIHHKHEDEASRRPSTSQLTPERKKSLPKMISIRVDSYEETTEPNLLSIPKVHQSASSDSIMEDISIQPCQSCGAEVCKENLTVEQRRRLDRHEEKKKDHERKKCEERRKSDTPEVKFDEEPSTSQEGGVRRKSDVIADRKRSILSDEARKVLSERRRSEIPHNRLKPEDRRRLEILEKRPRVMEERKRSSVDSGPVVPILEERRKSSDDEKKKNIYRHISSPRLERKTTDKQRSISLESEVCPEELSAEAKQKLNDLPAEQAMEKARTSIASVHASTQAVIEFFQGFYKRSQREGEQREPQVSSRSTTARSSFQHDIIKKPISKAGVVITSFKPARRRSSFSYASTAFAIATCAADNPILRYQQRQLPSEDKTRTLEHIISTAATMRVLNVLRHWISKQGRDFELNKELKRQVKEFLEEIRYTPTLTSTEHKAAAQLVLLLDKQDEDEKPTVDLKLLLSPPLEPSRERIETLSALEIAEQLTYIDHQIFIQICPEELMDHSWMRKDKAIRAPHVIMMIQRFNDVSRLVSSEILTRTTIAARVTAIEKWTAVADIARCLHNFNGVLQICSAFTNAAIFRLKKTWDKVSKTAKQTIEKLQKVVSSDGRFRVLRDTLHKCDPPCIPYLGLYLTDLSFIEEGTPNFIDDDLLNFSKMRMIAHIIREIRSYQQTSYKIDLLTRVSSYLLDTSLMMSDDELYATSLALEPRSGRLKSQSSIGGATPW